MAAQEVLRPLECLADKRWRQPKSTADVVRLPFFDDFAEGKLAPSLWNPTTGATAGFDVDPLAPTVGVATLDAIGSDGRLYSHASTNLFPADTLCSARVALDSFSLADSVVLSFYWMPGGGHGNLWERSGDTPDEEDSLFLDFYRAVDSVWVTVWKVGGTSVDDLVAATGTAWQYATVVLDDVRFFDSSFMFRFRNYASLEASSKAGRAGNCDHWHIDYVFMDSSRNTVAEASPRDIAFAAPAQTMLRTYRAMPYWQYTSADMADSLHVTLTNLYSSTLASHYTYSVRDAQGHELGSYDGGFENIQPHQPDNVYQTAEAHARPPVDYSFPAMTTTTAYSIVHCVSEGTAGDMYPANDTVRYRQIFSDYYAYDDGTPENGYGLTSTASRLYLAYRFQLGQADTLTALDIYFNPVADGENEEIPFYITVWSMQNGAPGQVLYRDEMRRFPRTGEFYRYVLERPVLVGEDVCVGFEQSGNSFINLGYDRSKNTADRIWYLTGTEWQQSILSGSLMLRPCFRAAATVGIEANGHAQHEHSVYPNPARTSVHVSGLESGSTVEVYNTNGVVVMESPSTSDRDGGNVIDVSSLPQGLYLIRVVTPQGMSTTHKLIIQH